MKIISKLGFKNKANFTAVIYCLIGVILSVSFNSRAFLIGFASSLCFLYIAIYGVSKVKKIRHLLLLSIIFFTSALFFKRDSSLGRLLIYKISSKALGENILTGIGINQFEHKYLLLQTDYFKNQKFNEKELLLADNTYFAFNDYYQLIVELGISAAFGLGILFYLIVTIIKLSLKNDQSSKVFLYLSIVNIITISVAALLNHIFDRPLLCMTWLLSFLFVFDKTSYNCHRKWLMVTPLIYLLLVIPNLYKSDRLDKVEEANTLWDAGYKTESLELLNPSIQIVQTISITYIPLEGNSICLMKRTVLLKYWKG